MGVRFSAEDKHSTFFRNIETGVRFSAEDKHSTFFRNIETGVRFSAEDKHSTFFRNIETHRHSEDARKMSLLNVGTTPFYH
jgi:rRNA maturation protein Nop10